ncbi:MAG: DUF4389 domain-containing protein [Jiangellaceae bacterium]|nr:DUF4389 domain-containing protein [Jiangellaceae bacterium]
MASTETYPLRVEGALDSPLSRWLWLVKWFLAIPHYVVLAFLWVAFVLLSAVAFVAILFTGRYPRAIFEFNVGVLRWSWRVQYYTYGALGTDRYPPFTLADVPDYPARLDVAYPERLSRGLVLVQWWLLAIPHYLLVALFIGGGTWVAWQYDNQNFSWAVGGLIGLLVFIAAIVLAFTGRYPQPVYDLVLGLNRWVLRVAAYAGLMTDQYPPFRLDMGGHDPGGRLTIQHARPAAPALGNRAGSAPTQPPSSSWTAGRVTTLVIGVLVTLIAMPLMAAGGTALVVDQLRDNDGYVSFGTQTYDTSSYAIASETIELRGVDADWDVLQSLVGTVRVRVTSDADEAVFVGIAPAADVARYLAGVERLVVGGPQPNDSRTVPGDAPATPPAPADIWTEQVTGSGQQTLNWGVQDGDWTVVTMNADGSAGVSVRSQTAATVPALFAVGLSLLLTGVVLFGLGVTAVIVAVQRASRSGQRPVTT